MQFQPVRLQEACKDRRIRIGELADMSGLSRVTVSNLANGRIRYPQRDTIVRLSWALKRPERFFYTPIKRDYIDTTVLTYRSFSSRANLDNASVDVKVSTVKDVAQYLFSFINKRDIDIPSDIIKDHGSNLNDSDYVEALALRLRDYWGLGQSAIGNMTILLENHGIICSRLDMPSRIESVNSCSYFDGSERESGFVITSNKTTYFRRRFTLAHELGHIVLHHYLDKEDYIKKTKDIEGQANLFASAFLMPHRAFVESVHKRTFSELLSLKKQWGVSIAACARRLLDLYLISDNQYESMNIELSKKGWRKVEPLDDSIEPEKPYYIEEGYRFLFEQKVTTPAVVLDNFNMYPSELANYIGNENLLMPASPDTTYMLHGE